MRRSTATTLTLRVCLASRSLSCAETARGRRVATRAMGLLIAWSFRELGMGRIQALVHPDNPRSAGMLDRLGFHRARSTGTERLRAAVVLGFGAESHYDL